MLNSKMILLAFSLSVIACQKAPTEDQGLNTIHPDKLMVGMELQFPPFETLDANGKPAGFSVELAQGLANHLERELVIIPTNWVALVPGIQAKHFDLVISSMSITDERRQAVDFSDPYAEVGLGLLIYNDSPLASSESLETFTGTLIAKRGTLGQSVLETYFPQITLLLVENVAAAALSVAQGKADAFIYDPLTLYQNHLNFPQNTRLDLNPIQHSLSGWGIVLHKDRPALLNAVNAFVQQFREQGGFERLADKHLAEIKTVFEEQGIPFFIR